MSANVTSKQLLTCFTFNSFLEKHSDDRHHGQSAVRQLGTELFSLLSRVRCRQHLESKVSSGSRSSRWLILGNLAECHVCQDSLRFPAPCARHRAAHVTMVHHVKNSLWNKINNWPPWNIKKGGEIGERRESVQLVCMFTSGVWGSSRKDNKSQLYPGLSSDIWLSFCHPKPHTTWTIHDAKRPRRMPCMPRFDPSLLLTLWSVHAWSHCLVEDPMNTFVRVLFHTDPMSRKTFPGAKMGKGPNLLLALWKLPQGH